MRIGNFKRLDKNVYKEEDRDFLEQLSFPVNDGFDKLYDLANNKISLADNILCTVQDISVEVNASGIPKTTTNFRKTFTSRVLGVQVIRATSDGNTAIYPTGGVFLSFTDTTTGGTVDHVAGLPANASFSLRLVIWGT